jgi:hypothetical protein
MPGDPRLPVRSRRRLVCSLLASLTLAAQVLHAQQIEWVRFPRIGEEGDDRLRIAQLLDEGRGDNVLLRSASRLLEASRDSTGRPRILVPEVFAGYASALPYSTNDGALRASRGLNLRIAGGIEVTRDRWHFVIAPELLYEANRPYQALPYTQNGTTLRDPFSNPFHPLPESIDLPLRYGDHSHLRLDLGQSSATTMVGRVEVGLANENLWWGPGVENAIVMSSNAAGFPHLLVRSADPLQTRAGLIAFDAIAGMLSESAYFDSDPSNDFRLALGGAVSWQHDRSAGLQLGLSRLRISGNTGHDQVTSVFGRWRSVPAGFELYAEWARFQDPSSVRDLLEFPTRSEGYTYGLQWVHPVTGHRTVRLHAELTSLEPTPQLRLRPEVTSYTSATVPQGFTQNGEVLGASIGPGSSSQWAAADLLGSTWRFGVFGSRIRYDNGARFTASVPPVNEPDVTIRGGIRAAVNLRATHVSLELTDAVRLNYLFQGGYVADPAVGGFQGIDITNRTLSLIFSPAARY